MFMVAFLV